jgi:hypothetical protein
MKLNMTTSEALALNNAITYAQNTIKAAPLKLGLRLAYNAKQLDPVVSSFNAEREKLVKQFGETDANGELVIVEGQVTLTDRAGFEAAVKDLLEETFDIELRELAPDVLPDTIDAVIVGGLFPIIEEAA